MLVSLALLALVLWQIDLPETWRVLRGVIWHWAALSWLTLLALMLLMAYRWHFILPPATRTLGYGKVLRLTWVSSVVGMFVPGVIGIEAVKIAGMARSTADLAQAFSSVMLDRLLGLLALVLLVLIGVTFGPLAGETAIALWAWGIFTAALLGAAALMNRWVRDQFERALPRAVRPRIVPRLHKVYDRLDDYRGRPLRLAAAVGLALVYQLGRVIHFIFTAWALGVDPPATFMLAVVPVVIFMLMLPISFSGIGLREAAFVYFLGQVGVPSESAFTISVLAYALYVTVLMPGAFMLRGWTKRPVEPTPAPPTTPVPAAASREERG